MPRLSTPKRSNLLAPPLPVTNQVLNSAGVTLRQGQFSLLASAPRVGKSVFATNLAIRTPVPSVFFSADSDEWTVRSRAASILTGMNLEAIEKQLVDETWDEYMSGVLHKADHVDWCYRSDIDMEFICQRVDAYREIMGDYPKLMVIDNLGNAIGDAPDEMAELRRICRDLQALARGTRAHIMGLHHVTGAKEDGFKPIGLGDLIGKIGKIPEVVLGMCFAPGVQNQVNLTVPKNRGGKSNLSLNLGLNYATATVGGYPV
jgi:replicative DNA helicase